MFAAQLVGPSFLAGAPTLASVRMSQRCDLSAANKHRSSPIQPNFVNYEAAYFAIRSTKRDKICPLLLSHCKIALCFLALIDKNTHGSPS